MADTKQKAGSDRREFLKLASLGSIAGGAAIVAGNPAQASQREVENGSGYQETEHVKAFYKSVRF
jgi:hypothetical protein